MIYEPSVKDKMDKIYNVFADYIRSDVSIDIVYTDKLGYMVMMIDERQKRSIDIKYVKSAEELCAWILNEICSNVMCSWERDDDELSEDDKEKIRETWKPYIDQLPEYHAFSEEFLSKYPCNDLTSVTDSFF